MLLIFDFDGTLADTRELIVETNQEVMRRMGYPVKSEDEIGATIGLPLVEGLLHMFPDLPKESLDAWVSMYREVFEDLRHRIVPSLFPGVKETLTKLHSDGHVLTVASSRKNASLNGFLQDMGVAPLFSYVVGVEDVTKAKPHPEPVLKTLEAFGCPASGAMVIGDMPVDIRMGAGAGVRTCGVSYGNASREILLSAGADYVIDSLPELISLVAIG